MKRLVLLFACACGATTLDSQKTGADPDAAPLVGPSMRPWCEGRLALACEDFESQPQITATGSGTVTLVAPGFDSAWALKANAIAGGAWVAVDLEIPNSGFGIDVDVRVDVPTGRATLVDLGDAHLDIEQSALVVVAGTTRTMVGALDDKWHHITFTLAPGCATWVDVTASLDAAEPVRLKATPSKKGCSGYGYPLTIAYGLNNALTAASATFDNVSIILVSGF